MAYVVPRVSLKGVKANPVGQRLLKVYVVKTDIPEIAFQSVG